MIIIGIKELCHIKKEEIVAQAGVLSPFYCEYVLSPVKEKESAERLLHSAARLAVVEMLSRFCKQRFTELPSFSLKNGGKPYFEGQGDVYFSFSHSSRLAVCAVSIPDVSEAFGEVKLSLAPTDEGEAMVRLRCSEVKGEPLVLALDGTAQECIGVDIQESHQGELCYNHEKVAQRFFDASMLARLENDKSESNFTSLWCELESLAKMTGEGVAAFDRKTKAGAKTYTVRITDTDGNEYFLALSYR